MDAAWPHIAATRHLEENRQVPAAGRDRRRGQHPSTGGTEILGDLTDSDDEDLVDAVYEAMAMAEGLSGEDDEDDDAILR